MSTRLYLIELHLPAAVRRRVVRQLVRRTAEAFGAPAPDVGGLSTGETIAAFAAFTKEEAESAIAAGPTRSEAVRDRLYRSMREMGAAMRRRLGIRTPAEAVRALRLLYHEIGIELNGDAGSGEITISNCAFSRTYTPAVCAFIAALDVGIAEGITGGARLAFTARITEGAPCCRALLK